MVEESQHPEPNIETLSKIKNRKNYFVRVRAYYKSDNKNYYGDWSSYKKINIK